MTPTKKLPLFIITGASGVGKSTLCNELFKNEKDYIVLEGDLLWNDTFNTPQDDYKDYRSLWMRLCAEISQIGKPIVLCGCGTPPQFETRPERELFTKIHYIAIVCSEKNLESRMREGRKIQDEGWIKSSIDFNRWFIENGEKNHIHLIHTDGLSPCEGAELADKIIISLA